MPGLETAVKVLVVVIFDHAVVVDLSVGMRVIGGHALFSVRASAVRARGGGISQGDTHDSGGGGLPVGFLGNGELGMKRPGTNPNTSVGEEVGTRIDGKEGAEKPLELEVGRA